MVPSREVIEARARHSRGISDDAIYRRVVDALAERAPRDGALLDVGCGVGGFRAHALGLCCRYVGADVIRHHGLADEVELALIDRDGVLPFESNSFDVVVSGAHPLIL